MRALTETGGPADGASRAGLGFLGRAAAWALVLFGSVRLPWVEQNLLLPFALAQGRVACALAGTSPDSVVVGLSCTGADPIALVLASVLAFPAPWRDRLRGCALGVALIVALNTVRIGTLSLVVGSGRAFELLHVYVWPAVLIIAAAAYVFRWMGNAVGRRASVPRHPAARVSFSRSQTLRFLGLLTLLVAIFYALSPWSMRSPAVLEVARWATLAAAAVMKAFGVPVTVADNLLQTPHGIWVVTQACVVTPLLPVYLAAVGTLPMSRTRRALAALAALPLFLLLGSARLLVLALPAAVLGSHAVAIHAFYQLLAAGAIVGGVAWLADASRTAAGRVSAILRALATGAAIGFAGGLVWRAWLRPIVEGLAPVAHLGHGFDDSQGALGLMPAFAIGLFAALQVALRRPLWSRSTGVAFAALAGSLAVAHVVLGEVASHTGVELPIAAIRAISLALPLVAIWLAPRPQASPLADDRVG